MILNHRNYVIINPGSVGQPRNGRPGADYAVLDSLENRVTFKHLDYKHESILQNSVSLISENSANLLGRCDEDRLKKNPCGLGEFYFQFRI
jgi:diadenosine tetraphosphatase ApaH/serine/threonine PP2A family protein phosphatase